MNKQLNRTKRISPWVATCLVLAMLFTQTGFGPAPQTTPEADAETQAGSPLATITQVDTSQFPVVTVYVSVIDANGEPVPVNPNQIVIMENGEEMALDNVGGVDDIGPLATLLVIDISGSMNHGGKLKAAQQAAQAYVDQARTSDQIGLVTFNTEIKYEQPLTSDRRKMIQAIKGLQAEEDTAMYDVLAEGIDILEAVDGRKDGLDGWRSKMSSQQVLQLIGPQGLSISVIGLGDPSHSLDEPALTALAEQAGGAYGYANDAASLTALYQKYGRAMQSEYVVTYTSPSKLRDGVNRALSASVKDSAGAPRSSQAPISYNPGGLAPEVSQPASFWLFLGLTALLASLLFVPFLFRLLLPKTSGEKNGKSAKKNSSGVKLRSQSSAPKPKVKLKS